MPIYIQKTDPVTISKIRINESDLENPTLPTCDKSFWIIDGDAVREMTIEEKVSRALIPEPPTAEEIASEVAEVELANGDALFAARGLEDLIDYLDAQGVITKTSLLAAKTNLATRLNDRIAKREIIS